MQARLLDVLRCPEDRGELKIVEFGTRNEPVPHDVDEGVVVCARGHLFPIVDGIPRMLPAALTFFPAFATKWDKRINALGLGRAKEVPPQFQSLVLPTLRRFQLEWEKHDIEGSTWGFDQTARVEHFLEYTALPREHFPGRLVLDAGCGTGQLTCSYSTLGCEVVGLDLAPALLRGWRLRDGLPADQAARIHFVQGDLMKPPFRDAAFDVIHSSGVLHHTPDTRRAFRALAALTRPGGACAVWLYSHFEETRFPLIPLVRARWLSVGQERLRRFTPRLPPFLLYSLLYAYAVYVRCGQIAYRVLRGRTAAGQQPIRATVTNMFDALAPPYQWKHAAADVQAWFDQDGFTDVRNTSLPSDLYGFNLRGVRAEGERS